MRVSKRKQEKLKGFSFLFRRLRRVPLLWASAVMSFLINMKSGTPMEKWEQGV